MTSNKSRFPPINSIFLGEINDLSGYDAFGWRRREIIFHKAEYLTNKKSDYPTKSQNDYIVLVDTSKIKYRCNFSQRETEDVITVGTPSQLKPWYIKKGFSFKMVKQNTYKYKRDKVFLEYTGKVFEFNIYTKGEFQAKYPNISVY